MGTAASIMAKIAKTIATIIKKAAQAISRAAGKTTEVAQQAGKAQNAASQSADNIQRSAQVAEKESSKVKDRSQPEQRESRAAGGTLGTDEDKVTKKTTGKNKKDPAHQAQKEEDQDKKQNVQKTLSKAARSVVTLGASKVVDKSKEDKEDARGEM